MSSAAPAGRTIPALVSLTAPVRALLTVAGDELRKDGGNETNRVLRANHTEQPKGWGPNLGIQCTVNTRYDKLASSFRAMVTLACIEQCIRADFSDRALCLSGPVD